MYTFKSYLVEYLTDEQRARYKNVNMTPNARRGTDHFFGKGNDEIHGEIQNDDKSEIHKQLETHLGQEISHDDYRRGMVKDKHLRDVKIGRMIKDEKLRNDFNSDPSRASRSNFATRTVRGTEVAGQTNSAPNAEHPKGHSWGGASCKNVDTGINKHYLHDEIKHGTVVHFVKDHNGQEIYRATLQPHHNDRGKVAYAVDSEYGIKHPKFTADSHRVAAELSGKPRGSVIHDIHGDVYNDSGESIMVHPGATDRHITNILKNGDWSAKHVLSTHPGLSSKHISALINDGDPYFAEKVLTNPNVTQEHIHQAMQAEHPDVVAAALRHPLATVKHLNAAMSHSDPKVRIAAVKNKKAPEEILSKAQDDKTNGVRRAVAEHPNATPQHLDKSVQDVHWGVRAAAALNKNINADHISKIVADKDPVVVRALAYNPNLTSDHITKILKGGDATAMATTTQHKNFNAKHLQHVLKHGDEDAVGEAVKHSKDITPGHLDKLQYHSHWRVRHNVADHPKTSISALKNLSADSDHDVRETAKYALHNRITFPNKPHIKSDITK